MSEIRAAGDEWQLSPTVSLIRVGEMWLMDDPARGSHRILNTLPRWLGHSLAALASSGTMKQEQVIHALEDAGVPEGQGEACFKSFVEAGVLVGPSPSTPERDAGNLRDRQWAVISPPVNYRDPATKDADIQLMYSYAEETNPPASATQVPETWARVQLPLPERETEEDFLGRLGRLLHLTYGVQSEMNFGPLPRSRRTPPSFGASHPFDISVTTKLKSDGRTAYYYHPSEHSLVALPASQCDHGESAHATPGGSGVYLSIHLAIERVHWRYRTSTVYPTVLLDLGHLTETLGQVAESMGIVLTATAGRVEPTLPKRDQTLGPALRTYHASLETRGC